MIFRHTLVALALLPLSSVLVAPAMAADNTVLPVPLRPVVDAAHRTCAARTPSGLGYTVLVPATEAGAPKPTATDYVLLNYIGYLAATGDVFDQANETPLQVSGAIPGFTEALQMMPKGSTYRFCIPAALGYGAEASGPIPANSDLVFQVELVDLRTAAEIEAMQKAHAAANVDAAAPGQPSAPPKN